MFCFSHAKHERHVDDALAVDEPVSVTSADGGSVALLMMRLRRCMRWRQYSSVCRESSQSLGKRQKMTPADVDAELRAHERSMLTATSWPPLFRIDINQLSSNLPIEDQYIATYHKGTYILGVIDGHGGPACAQAVKTFLPSYIIDSLPFRDQREQSPARRSEILCRSLKNAFEALDSDITLLPNELFFGLSNGRFGSAYVKKAARTALLPALSGCVATVALIEGTRLYVANAGDCRAVLGRRRNDGTVQCIELTQEHTCQNASELEYLYAHHPREETTLCQVHPTAGGLRLLGGLMPTRAFGDAVYKWPQKWQRRILPYIYDSSRPGPSNSTPPCYYSPPYLRVTPEIRTHELHEDDLFMVVATDGLFDEIPNNDVVQLVHQHLQTLVTQDKDTTCSTVRMTQTKEDDVMTSIQPSLNFSDASLTTAQMSSESVQPHQETIHESDKSSWTVNDQNIATHLIRSALGGNDHERVATLLSLPYPLSRDYRDDITVLVTLFDADAIRAAKIRERTQGNGTIETVQSTKATSAPPININGLDSIQQGKRFRTLLPPRTTTKRTTSR